MWNTSENPLSPNTLENKNPEEVSTTSQPDATQSGAQHTRESAPQNGNNTNDTHQPTQLKIDQWSTNELMHSFWGVALREGVFAENKITDL